MSVDTATLETFVGKQVILHKIIDGGELKELEGKVEAASIGGVAFKEKGKRDLDLVLPDEIEEITLAPTKPKNVIQKKLKPIGESTVRQHLGDRHGVGRAELNGLSDEEALKRHDAIDHADLTHKHVEPDNDEDDTEAGDDSED